MTFDRSEYRCIEIDRPFETAGRLALGYAILMSGVPGDDESAFPGCLVRITARDIWSETFDRVGHRALELFGLRTQEQRTPSFMLEPGELVDAQLVTALPLLWEWDAYVIPADATFVAFISHDEPLQITTGSPNRYETLFERLELGGWEARERVRRHKL